MNVSDFPSPLDRLPRPGMREIRVKQVSVLPQVRYERSAANDGKENEGRS